MTPRHRSEAQPPDLFANPRRGTSRADGNHVANKDEMDRRYVLPRNLAAALSRLSDKEIQDLAEAVAGEVERRDLAGVQDREPVSKEPSTHAVRGKPPQKRGATKSAQQSKAPRLTRARINAIRAAIKAGVKPTMVARQFGVSRSAIREALSGNEDR